MFASTRSHPLGRGFLLTRYPNPSSAAATTLERQSFQIVSTLSRPLSQSPDTASPGDHPCSLWQQAFWSSRTPTALELRCSTAFSVSALRPCVSSFLSSTLRL